MHWLHISGVMDKSLTRRVNLARKKFGELTVTTKWRGTGNLVEWLCRCSCGYEVWVRSDNLRSGRSRSCGVEHDCRNAGLEEVRASQQ